MPHAARVPPNKVSSSGTHGMPGCKKSTSSKPADLRCMLITVLMDNQSNGMTLKVCVQLYSKRIRDIVLAFSLCKDPLIFLFFVCDSLVIAYSS